MVGFLKIFGYLWLGKYIFLTQNIFSAAPTLGINSDRSLRTLKKTLCKVAVTVIFSTVTPLIGKELGNVWILCEVIYLSVGQL